jgi:hypothetical protein
VAKAIIRMPDELHRALKMEAVRRGIPMQELANAAIERVLAGGGKSGPVSVPAKETRPAPDTAALAGEEAELVHALLAFMREERDPLRAAGLRVIRAALEEHLGRRRRRAGST